MLSWFRQTKPVCPVDPAMRQWIDDRWHWLETQFGTERARTARVILPRPEFFPEPLHTWDDANRLKDRMCGYMDIEPTDVELTVYQDRNPVVENGLHPRTAGLYQSENGKFLVWIEVSNLDDPLGMVSTMAHELGRVHLLGSGRISDEVDDHEPLTDLLTVYFGLRVLTANSVIRENCWHAGAMSGWDMGRRGYLGMTLYGYALAKFARTRGEDGANWSHELRLDVRTAFSQTMPLFEEEQRIDNRDA